MQRFGARGNPEWLESLGGESPLLSRSQCEFVSNVRSMIARGMATGAGEISPAARHTIKHDLPDIANDFVEIVEHLKTSSSARFNFLEAYVGWRILRQNTIRELKKIAKSIDDDKENCETAKIIGSSMSFLGGGLCLMSGKKEQNVSQLIGSIMMGIGNLTTAGTSAVGTLLLHENIQAAKKAVGGDKRYMAKMLACLTDTTDLLGTLDNIKSVGADSGLKSAAWNLLEVSKKNMSGGCMQTEVKAILKYLDCPPDLRNGIADAVGLLVSTLMLCDRFRPMFDLAVKGSGCLPRLRNAYDLFQSAAGVGTALSVNKSAGLTVAQRTRVIQGMAADVADIALTALERDTESAESAQIRQAADSLAEEAEKLEELYHGMHELNQLERQREEYF